MSVVVKNKSGIPLVGLDPSARRPVTRTTKTSSFEFPVV
jgi:hypothetical protein